MPSQINFKKIIQNYFEDVLGKMQKKNNKQIWKKDK